MQISDFRKYLSQINERIDYSEGTKEFYRKHLLVMDNWFYKNGVRAIDDITLSMLNEFIAYSRKEY
jgi:site-specific recombinase XerC